MSHRSAAALAFVFGLTLACGAAARADDAPTAPPAPGATGDAAAMAPLDLPATCDVDLGMSVAQSLGRTIADDASLRFVGAVRALSAVQLARAAAVALDPALVGRLGKASQKACTGALASVIATRAFAIAYATAPTGHLDMSASDRIDLLGNLANAAGALATRDHLARPDVDAALAPFDLTLAQLTASPAASPAPCAAGTTSPASLVTKFTPIVPLTASNYELGQVRVTVDVDEAALVPYVRLHDTVLTTGSRLITESLIAAAASTYAPARDDCKAAPGSYLFTAEYAP